MRRHAALVLCAALAAGASACGGSTVADGRVAAPAALTGVRLDVVWRHTLVDPEFFTWGPREFGGAAVSGDGRIVVTGTRMGEVVAVDASTGVERWRNAWGEPFAGRPVIDGDTTWIPRLDGTLTALWTTSGVPIWSLPLGTPLSSTPVVDDKRVFVVGANQTLYAVDRVSGALAWQYPTRLPADLVLDGERRVTLLGDSLVAGFADGSLHRIGLDGRAMWSTDLSRGSRRLADVDSAPLVWGERVYASSFAGGVFAIDLRSGEHLWHTELNGASTPLQTPGGRLVVTTASGLVAWLDPSTGRIIESLQLEATAPLQPVRLGSFLLVATTSAGVYVLDAETPWIHNRFSPGEGTSSRPVGRGDRAWLVSDRGYLYELLARAL